MRNILVVSTYPEFGSMNVGDLLISEKTKELLRDLLPDVGSIDTIWREASAPEMATALQKIDTVIFACLAIRNSMAKTYPTLPQIIASKKRIAVLAAGTSLTMGNPTEFARGQVSEDSLETLRALEKGVECWTNRGLLTQAFCETVGLTKTNFSGDLAFWGKSPVVMAAPTEIRSIAISDPHYFDRFREPLIALVQQLRTHFSAAELTVVIHGKDTGVCSVAQELELKTIYLPKIGVEGLGVYGACDLHVGFRVHAHVSALNRGTPSYLLEQDGRGTDYGFTLCARSTVPCYQPKLVANPSAVSRSNLRNAVRSQLSRLLPWLSKGKGTSYPSVAEQNQSNLVMNRQPQPKPGSKGQIISPAELIVQMMVQDFRDGYLRFRSVGEQIEQFRTHLKDAIDKIR